MAAPTTTNYKLENWGHADPGGNTDYWNRYCKALWGNITAYNSGAGEHDRDGDHMADFFHSIRNRSQPKAPASAGFDHALATTMAGMSLRTGARVEYDSTTDSVYSAEQSKE